MSESLLRRKAIVPDQPHGAGLARTLSWPHLVALGVGAIVGTGILALIGVGADKAGPAVILSFAIAGLICACAALAYAEMATMIPASGSAYTYSYVVIGELIAWVVGWSLILEYSLVVSAVAVGWSGYAAPLLHAWADVPMALMQGPELGGIVNLPAIAIIAVVAGMLLFGTRESATVNAILVLVKIAALVVFVAVALPAFDAANLEPFSPYGFAKHMGADGVERETTRETIGVEVEALRRLIVARGGAHRATMQMAYRVMQHTRFRARQVRDKMVERASSSMLQYVDATGADNPCDPAMLDLHFTAIKTLLALPETDGRGAIQVVRDLEATVTRKLRFGAVAA